MKERLCLEVERHGFNAIIMGSRGFGASKRGSNGRLGSVSDYCVRHCVCPVVVVHYPDEKDVNDGDDAMVTVAEANEVAAEDEEEYHDASDERKGENYRFGYRVAGDASQLLSLCDKFGLQAFIINSVMDRNQDMETPSQLLDKKERGQVSSTCARYALSIGDINYVSDLLGRHHCLILSAEKKEEFVGSKNHLSTPKTYLLNLPPKEGLYNDCSLIVGDENQLPCRVFLDSTHIHLESDDKELCFHDVYTNHPLLGIEFKGA